MKAQYSFTTLRYVHDIVTGEFANIGVLLYSPAFEFLEFRYAESLTRLSRFFGAVPSKHIRSVARQLRFAFDDLASQVFGNLFAVSEGVPKDALECARRVFPHDDSSLQFVESGFGVTGNPWQALDRTFARYVTRYSTAAKAEGRRDDEIWKVFRRPLMERAPRVYLEPRVISGRNYEHEFPISWRNGIVNVAEPVSFDLRDHGEIVEKANRWLGRGISLRDSSENFRMVLLLGEPSNPAAAPYFEKAQNILADIPGRREIFTDREPESFADFVRISLEHADPNQRL